jgi:hypothetical protein
MEENAMKNVVEKLGERILYLMTIRIIQSDDKSYTVLHRDGYIEKRNTSSMGSKC